MSSTKKFTDLFLKSLKLRDGQPQSDYFDGYKFLNRGKLFARVNPKGVSLGIMYRVNGQRKRFTYGAYPKITLKKARIRAEADLALAAKGIDPQDDRRAYRANPRFKDVWPFYFDDLTAAASTKNKYHGYWRREIEPTIGTYKLADIDRRHIVKVTNHLKRAGKGSAANRCHALLSGFFKYALNEGFINSHPMYGMSPPFKGEIERDRYLNDREIGLLLNAIDDSLQGKYFLMMLYSIKRSDEVRNMKWSDIDEDGNWHSYNCKTKAAKKAPHLVPLSPQMRHILDSMPRVSDYVFASRRSKTGHISSSPQYYDKLNEVMGTTENSWAPHDLRRTGATILEKQGVKPEVIEALLAHTPDKIVRTYRKYQFREEKLEALSRLGRHIDKCRTRMQLKAV